MNINLRSLPHYSTIVFALAFVQIFNAQILPPDTVSKFIRTWSLRPLQQVDTTTIHLPKNLVTKSGWHLDYYAEWIVRDTNQLTVWALFYNDEHFYHQGTTYRPNNIHYDSMIVIKETEDFIYLKNLAPNNGENVTIYSTKGIYSYYLNQLISADLINNIFIGVWNEDCQDNKKLDLQVFNINHQKEKRIRFKNICECGKSNWCVTNVSYVNGKLTITASLTNLRTKKSVTEKRSLKI